MSTLITSTINNAIIVTTQPSTSTQTIADNIPASSPDKRFLPQETGIDKTIAEACENGILDKQKRLTERYLKLELSKNIDLTSYNENIQRSLDIIISGDKTLREFLNDQYEQSLIEGNQIVYHKYIGSCVYSYGGKHYEIVFEQANLTSLLNEHTRSNFEIKPKDLDLRDETKKRATKEQVLNYHKRAEAFCSTPLKYNESKNDPNRILRFENRRFSNGDEALPIDFGYGNFPDFSLTDRTAVHIGLKAQALYEGRIEIVLLSPPNTLLKAYADQALGISDVMNETVAKQKNYAAVLTVNSEIIRGKKCYDVTRYQMWIRNHAQHFENKWGLWPAKFADFSRNSSKHHIEDTLETHSVYFLQFETLLEKAENDVKAHFGKGLLDAAWVNLTYTMPPSKSWLYLARQKGIPARLIQILIVSATGLVWASPVKRETKNGYSFVLSSLFDEEPHIQLQTPEGLIWMIPWNLDGLENIEEAFLPYLTSARTELISIIKNTCAFSKAEETALPLLKKYALDLPSINERAIENAERLIDSQDPILQFIGFSFLSQMHTLGLHHLETLLFSKAIPNLLSCQENVIRTLTLNIAATSLLDATSKHLHPNLLKELKACQSTTQWLEILASTHLEKYVRMAKNRWKEAPALQPKNSPQYVLNVMSYYPLEGIPFLANYLNHGGKVNQEEVLQLKPKLLTVLENASLTFSEWLALYEIFSDLSMDFKAIYDLPKDKFLSQYIQLFSDYKKARGEGEKLLLNKKTVDLTEQLLDLCRKHPWGVECQIAAQIFNSRLIVQHTNDFKRGWQQLLDILGNASPILPLQKNTLSTLSAFTVRALRTNKQWDNNPWTVQNTVMSLFSNFLARKETGTDKYYQLLRTCLKHPLFAKPEVIDPLSPYIDPLSSYLVSFFENSEALLHPILELLEESVARNPAFFSQLSTESCYRLITHLLSLENDRAFALAKSCLKTLKKSQQIITLSPSLTLAGRHHSDSELHLLHADLGADRLKNDLLLERAELLIVEGQESAYSALTELSALFQKMSSDQRMMLSSCIRFFFSKVAFLKSAKEWFLSTILNPPIEIGLWIECAILLLHHSKDTEVIKALETALTKHLQEKTLKISPQILTSAYILILENSTTISSTTLELSYPYLNEEHHALWKKTAIKHLDMITSQAEPFKALTVFLHKYFNCDDPVFIEKVFKFIFSDSVLIANHLYPAVQKYHSHLNTQTWHYIWNQAVFFGKNKSAKDIYLLWQASGQKMDEIIFQNILHCSFEEVSNHLKDPLTCEPYLKNPTLKPRLKHIALKVFDILIKKKCDESLFISWLNTFNEEIRADDKDSRAIYAKLIHHAFTSHHMTLLSNCIQYTVKHLYQTKNLQEHLEAYLESTWPTDAASYIGVNLLRFSQLSLKHAFLPEQAKPRLLIWLLSVQLEAGTEPNRITLVNCAIKIANDLPNIPSANLPTLFNMLSQAAATPLLFPNLIPLLKKIESSKLDPHKKAQSLEIIKKALLNCLPIDSPQVAPSSLLQTRHKWLNHIKGNIGDLLKEGLDLAFIERLTQLLISLLNEHNDIKTFQDNTRFFIDFLHVVANPIKTQILVKFCQELIYSSLPDENHRVALLSLFKKGIIPLFDEKKDVYENFCNDIVKILDHFFFKAEFYLKTIYLKYVVEAREIFRISQEKKFITEPHYIQMVQFFLKLSSKENANIEHCIKILLNIVDHFAESHPNMFELCLFSPLESVFEKEAASEKKLELLHSTMNSIHDKTRNISLHPTFFFNCCIFLNKTMIGHLASFETREKFLNLYLKFCKRSLNSLENSPKHSQENAFIIANAGFEVLRILSTSQIFTPISHLGNCVGNSIRIMSDHFENFVRTFTQFLTALYTNVEETPSKEEEHLLKELFPKVIDIIEAQRAFQLEESKIMQLSCEFIESIGHHSASLAPLVINKFLGIHTKNIFSVALQMLPLCPAKLYNHIYFAVLLHEGSPAKTLKALYHETINHIDSNKALRVDYSFLLLELCETFVLINNPNLYEQIDLNDMLGSVFSFLWSTKIKIISKKNSTELYDNPHQAIYMRFISLLEQNALDPKHPKIAPVYAKISEYIPSLFMEGALST